MSRVPALVERIDTQMSRAADKRHAHIKVSRPTGGTSSTTQAQYRAPEGHHRALPVPCPVCQPRFPSPREHFANSSSLSRASQTVQALKCYTTTTTTTTTTQPPPPTTPSSNGHMSWDYAFQTTAFDKTQLELSAHLPQDVLKQSFSSTSSDRHSLGMATDFTESEMESKLLPHNLWGDNFKSPSRPNTAEEQRFLQSQITGTDLWYSADFPHDSSSSASSIFEMKVHQTQAQHQHQYQHHLGTHSHQPVPHTRTQTPATTTSTTPLQFSMMPQALPPSLPQSSLQSPALGAPQLQQHLTQPQVQFTNSAAATTPLNTAQLLTTTQTMLQNYQQQQLYLEQLQQQQQQQAQLLQNPLFLQQQNQLVSQQLQQLQLQLQLQQQQIESLNAKKLEADKLPLTQENLTKLQQPPTEKDTTTTSKSSHSSENKSAVNTGLYKTELCSTFQKTGSCPYGNKCQFAHGQNELKTVERGTKWRSKPCANWTKTGSCRYGNRCCFKHE